MSASAEKAALVLLSGGMDSTTLLHHVAKDRGYDAVYTLAFLYGQRHVRELECAQWQAQSLGVTRHTVLDIGFVNDVVKGGTTLVQSGGEVPDLADVPEADRDQPPTYVPNRNMMLLSIAAAYAESNGIQDVYYGAQAVDEYGYWDCTKDFVQRINDVLMLNRRKAVTIHAPFLDKHKSDLLAIGQRLGVDYGRTWSCYRGGDKPCGACPTCVERATAFERAGMADPLLKA